MDNKKEKRAKGFSPQFWLVIMFEFFERGSYYGMMSFLSVYFTDTLNFPKESVGVIKGVIQPLLYFLPIISGAIADRFGYRRVLMVAFTLLGSGYFLTSQANEYGTVFAALVIMGIGAGTFKPIISGSIARLTDKSNSSLGFGIYYWSINLGAFLFPLILVPFLKKINPAYVIIASAIATASMLIPTAIFFKDPIKKEKAEKRNNISMIQTLANAFEIIYSPIILLYKKINESKLKKLIIISFISILFVYSLFLYLSPLKTSLNYSKIGITLNNKRFVFISDKNMFNKKIYSIKQEEKVFKSNNNIPNIQDLKISIIKITIFKPKKFKKHFDAFFNELNDKYIKISNITDNEKNILESITNLLENKLSIKAKIVSDLNSDYQIISKSNNKITININKNINLNVLKNDPKFYKYLWEKNSFSSSIFKEDIEKLFDKLNTRNFFPFFVIGLIAIGLIIILFQDKIQLSLPQKNPIFYIIILLGLSIWFLPGISVVGKIVSMVIYFTLLSLFLIDKQDKNKFIDHSKFLLMIIIYSGFWVLYFQMFDSVLWYVKSYVNPDSLNRIINGFLNTLGIHINWFFDVEHVTVINAGTIIALQLIISKIVSKKKALPTMMFGIGIATIGMGMLSVSTNIWVFIIGIILFSIGEMTAHPKFISYVGLIAPVDKKAMYMGYLFLYGVFGSSVGGIVGAKLYVHFVDNLNQPSTLWLIFSGIGIITILGLFLFNKFLIKKN